MQSSMIESANLFRLVQFFDVAAAVVFAVSGALVASRKGLDVMAFMWFAVITGVGGGTVRDLILNVPVTFGVRGLAIKFGWSLPVFRESTKRERWKSDPKDPARD
jgi:uncharacterized membrane protein YeiH